MDISNKNYSTYYPMKKEDIVCRYRKDKTYEEKDFFRLDNAHGIMDKAGCARTFSQVELDAIDWVIVRDGYFSMWRKEFIDKGDMFVNLDE